MNTPTLITTEQQSDVLFRRLGNKNLTGVEISRLVKDVVNTFQDGGVSTTFSVNEELEALGWGREMIDLTSLELIRYLFPKGVSQERIRLS
jgi:hypothetical protein